MDGFKEAIIALFGIYNLRREGQNFLLLCDITERKVDKKEEGEARGGMLECVVQNKGCLLFTWIHNLPPLLPIQRWETTRGNKHKKSSKEAKLLLFQ